MPQVMLVDMRKEMENGNRSVFSGQLVAALKNCVARGEQAMLLMNRRGYNSFGQLPKLRLCRQMPELRCRHDLPRRGQRAD